MAEDTTLAQMTETLRSEQRRRWQEGDRVPAERYLVQYCSVLADAEQALELVYNEVLLREELGETPLLEEYLQRFPQFDRRLRLLFEVHRDLASEELFSACGKTSAADGGQGSRGFSTELKTPAIPGYEIVRELGRGGMGVVYLARQTGLNRPAALKMILAGVYAGARELARFRTEVEAVGRVQHPNIVPIYEVGEENGRPYLSMEYVNGGSLAQQLAGAPLPAGRAAQLVEPLARAVHAAHQQGVIHRDLKPANILLQKLSMKNAKRHEETTLEEHAPGFSLRAVSCSGVEDFIPKITDFGLAKILVEGGAVQTQSGTVVGTPSYMAPEQAWGKSKEIGPAADIYSLGAILYELLTGRPPFRAETPLETLLQVQTSEPVSPSRLQPKLPRDLVTICLKCLQKEPRKRYGNVLELAEDLRHFLAREPIKARPIGNTRRLWRWCRRKPLIAGLSALVIVSVIGIAIISSVAAFKLDRSRGQAQSAEQDAEENLARTYLEQARAARASRRSGQRFDSLDALEKAGKIGRALHLDERFFLELRNEAIACMALTDLHVEKVLANHRLTREFPLGVGFDAALEFYAPSDPQGNLAVRRVDDDRQLVQLPGAGFPPFQVLFSSDGRFLAAKYYLASGSPSNSYRIWDWRLAKVVLNEPADSWGQGMAFSPDSRSIALGRHDGSMTIYDLLSGKKNRLELGYEPKNIAFHPKERQVAVCHSGHGLVQVRQIDTGMILRSFELPRYAHKLAWSDDGRLLAAACDDRKIHVWDTLQKGRQPLHVLEGHHQQVIQVVFSHAGDLLASSGWDETTRLWDVWAGQELVSTPGYCLHFGPNDRCLAGVKGAEPGIWKVANGSGCRKLYGHQGPRIWTVDFSPDGGLLASASTDGVRLWNSHDGRALAHLQASSNQAFTTLFYPDGSGLITSGDPYLRRWPIEPALNKESTSFQIGPAQRLRPLDLPRMQFISRDQEGHRLAGVAREYGGGGVVLMDLDEPEQKARWLPHPGSNWANMSPDGRYLATGTWQGTEVYVWDTATRKVLQKLPVRGSAYPIFSPAGQWLATAADDDYRFWHVGSWEPGPVIQAEQMAGWVGKVAFTGDDRGVVLVHGRVWAKLHDLATGREIATLAAPNPNLIDSLCLSPENDQLAVATYDKVIHLWDLGKIRRQLADMGLDWDATLPFSTAIEPRTVNMQVKVVPGDPKEQLEREREQYDRDLASNPNDVQAYRRRGLVQEKLGHFEQAVDDFSKALKLQPNSFELLRLRGWTYRLRKDFAAAVADWQEAHAIRPDSVEVCNNLAWIYVTGPAQLRDPNKALPLAWKAVRLPAHSSIYRNTLGVVFYRLGQFDAAIDTLERAIDDNKGEATANDAFFLAMSHLRLGNAKKAREYYDQALSWWKEQGSGLSQLEVEELTAFRAEADALFKQFPRP